MTMTLQVVHANPLWSLLARGLMRGRTAARQARAHPQMKGQSGTLTLPLTALGAQNKLIYTCPRRTRAQKRTCVQTVERCSQSDRDTAELFSHSQREATYISHPINKTRGVVKGVGGWGGCAGREGGRNRNESSESTLADALLRTCG